MSNVTSSASSTSSYLKDILDRRQNSIQERIDEAVKSGKLSTKNQASLDTTEKNTSQELKNSMADGILDRAEYQRLLRALNTESASLDRMLKVKTVTPKANASSGSALPMKNQNQTLSMIQDMQKRIHETVQKALSSGSISKAQGTALDKLESSEQDSIDQALENGVISKGEYAQIAKAQSAVSNKLTQYQRESLKKQGSGYTKNSLNAQV